MNNKKYSSNPIPPFAANPIIVQCQHPGQKLASATNQSQVLPGSKRHDRNKSRIITERHRGEPSQLVDVSRDPSPPCIDVMFGKLYIFATVLEVFFEYLYLSDNNNGIGGE